MDRMFPCPECKAEWPSELAASYCCDPDEDRGDR